MRTVAPREDGASTVNADHSSGVSVTSWTVSASNTPSSSAVIFSRPGLTVWVAASRLLLLRGISFFSAAGALAWRPTFLPAPPFLCRFGSFAVRLLAGVRLLRGLGLFAWSSGALTAPTSASMALRGQRLSSATGQSCRKNRYNQTKTSDAKTTAHRSSLVRWGESSRRRHGTAPAISPF